jgi:hypothetical protein
MSPKPKPRFWRCPLQILGLDHDERISAPAGEDPFVALQYALGLLDNGIERLSLENRRRAIEGTPTSWI